MSKAIAIRQESQVAVAGEFSREQVQLVKQMVCPEGTTDTELQFFITYAKRTGLDPFTRQIYCTKNRNKGFQVEVTIDGARLCAERTGDYEGQEDPVWCGPDGKWVDVWLSPDPPTACRVGIFRKGFRQATRAVALFDAYKQTRFDYDTKKHVLNTQWLKNPANMLAKCAESLALRKAFPRELSGIYTKDEMAQSENPEPAVYEAKPFGGKPGHTYVTEWNGIPVGPDGHDIEHCSHEYCERCRLDYEAEKAAGSKVPTNPPSAPQVSAEKEGGAAASSKSLSAPSQQGSPAIPAEGWVSPSRAGNVESGASAQVPSGSAPHDKKLAAWQIEFLKKMAIEKARDRKIYYDVIAGAGYEHANLITDRPLANRIIKLVRETIDERQAIGGK